jgi:hypothetical protein
MKIYKSYNYKIRVEGQFNDRWSDWFEGLTIHNDSDGETTLNGTLIDQSALLGVLIKLQALNLPILSVERLSSKGKITVKNEL